MALKLVIRARGQGGLGTKASCLFGPSGGTIGRSADCTWVLVDPRNEVSSQHAAIVHEGGQYCLIDQSTNGVFVNGAREPLGRGVKVALRHGDIVRIGQYEISAIIGSGADDVQTEDLSVADGYGLADLVVGDQTEDVVGGLASPSAADNGSGSRRDSPARLDPLTAFSPAPARQNDPTPDSPASDHLHADVTARPSSVQTAAEEDAAGDISGHFRPQTIAASGSEAAAFEHYLSGLADVAAPPRERVADPAAEGRPGAAGSADAGIRAIGSAMTTLSPKNHNLWPLFSALGLTEVPIPDERIPGLLHDIGASLRRAVEGLHDAYADGGTGSNLRIAAAQLQPLEDNPVKFSRTGAEAISALFGHRRAVHLGPEDAMRECLEGLQVHRGAVAAGTAEGLQAVISSFAPEALARRFAKYQPGHQSSGDDAWLWGMFEQYFDEARRNQSHGLRRLFDEVFAQAYDQHVRANSGVEAGRTDPETPPPPDRQPRSPWR